MKLFYSPRVLDHDAAGEINRGVVGEPFERPERAANVAAALNNAGLGLLVEPASFPDEHLLRVHDKDYVEFLRSAHRRWLNAGRKGDAIPMCWRADRMRPALLPTDLDAQLGYYAFDIMTPITEGSWQAARASVDTALSGAAHIASGTGQAAFSLCRPPGHHAGSDYYGGYCFLNGAAVAAQFLIDHGMSRIAILDPDYHHGNGTQDIFYARNDVLYVSLHADPATDFPFYTGFADEIGIGDGLGFNLNFPLARQTDWSAWADAYGAAEQSIRNFSPEAVVVSLGVDTLSGDPLSKFAFQPEDFGRLGGVLSRLSCPVLFVFEGGYAIDQIGANVVRTLHGFLGEYIA